MSATADRTPDATPTSRSAISSNAVDSPGWPAKGSYFNLLQTVRKKKKNPTWDSRNHAESDSSSESTTIFIRASNAAVPLAALPDGWRSAQMVYAQTLIRRYFIQCSLRVQPFSVGVIREEKVMLWLTRWCILKPKVLHPPFESVIIFF
jgi:hypothetical protein